MNNILKNKKYISITVLVLMLIVFVFTVYVVNSKVRNYKSDVLAEYNKLALLESEKTVFDTYNKILIKGSSESLKIKKHILSSDRKDVLALINQFEEYTKKVGLTENNTSPIVSVATRENAMIGKYNAGDLVITIRIIGNVNRINDFINILNNLPIVSYIEKIDMKFDNLGNKNSANITLIIYQKK